MQVRVWYHLDARFGASRFMVNSALEIRTLAQIASPKETTAVTMGRMKARKRQHPKP